MHPFPLLGQPDHRSVVPIFKMLMEMKSCELMDISSRLSRFSCALVVYHLERKLIRRKQDQAKKGSRPIRPVLAE